MLRVQDLKKSFGARVLFEDIDWHIPQQGCYGFVGPNGVGKTTLFRILMKEVEPDAGEVIHPKQVEVGYLPQEATVETDALLLDFVLDGASTIIEMEQKLEAMTHLLDASPEDEALQLSYVALQERFEMLGGYAIRSLAKQIIVGMGFSNKDFQTPMQSFSGGWRMKGLLCQLLLGKPDLLLLDEPTNHLDLESIEWLESFLKNYEGTVIVISHDRFFLNHIVQGIVELTGQELNTYPGTYDNYIRIRQDRIEHQRKLAAEQVREIERIEAFVERFRYKATKAKQVQSREKVLEQLRAEQINIDSELSAAMQFRFPEPERMGKVVVEARGLHKAYGERVLYNGVNFTLERGQKVAFVGPNGAGKTTLLNMIAGIIEPDDGSVNLGHQVTFSHFAQHSVDQLDLDNTILQEMEINALPETHSKVRSILGAFGFSGDVVHKKISILSGGEKTRVALAKLLLIPAGCLLLDEPTNHLDMLSRQVLEEALEQFKGAVCVVSHDRYFLNQFVNQVLHIEEGELTQYPGDFSYYQWKHKSVEPSATDDSSAAPDMKSKRVQRQLLAKLHNERQKETKKLRQTIKNIEQKIESTEAEHQSLEAQLADPETYQGDNVGEISKQYSDAEKQLESLMMTWEEVQESLEEIEARYKVQEDLIRTGQMIAD